jgi:hypothetical protein
MISKKIIILIVALAASCCIFNCEDQGVSPNTRFNSDSASTHQRAEINPFWTDPTINIGPVDMGKLHNDILQAIDELYDFSDSTPIDMDGALYIIQNAINKAALQYGYRPITLHETGYLAACVVSFAEKAGVDLSHMKSDDGWKLIDHARELGYIDFLEARAIKRLTMNFIRNGSEALAESSIMGDSETRAVKNYRELLAASAEFWSSEYSHGSGPGGTQPDGVSGAKGNNPNLAIDWGQVVASTITDAIYGMMVGAALGGGAGMVGGTLAGAMGSIAATMAIDNLQDWLDETGDSYGPGDFPPPCPDGQYLC